MCLTNVNCKDPTEPGVWWRDDAEWKLYNPTHSAAIQRAIANGASRVELGSVGSAKYAIDLVRMIQINLATGYERNVKLVKPPAAPGILAAPSDAKHASTLEMHLKILEALQSLKDMVLKNQAELAALRALVEENTETESVANYTIKIQEDSIPSTRYEPHDGYESDWSYDKYDGYEAYGFYENYDEYESYFSNDE